MTNEEITKFVAETKAAMDAGTDETFQVGIGAMCAFLAPLTGEEVLAWCRAVTNAYSVNKEQAQAINRELVKHQAYLDAIARYHVWHDATYPREVGIRYANDVLFRVRRIGHGETVDSVVVKAREYRRKMTRPDEIKAFEEVLRAPPSGALNSDARNNLLTVQTRVLSDT